MVSFGKILDPTTRPTYERVITTKFGGPGSRFVTVVSVHLVEATCLGEVQVGLSVVGEPVVR